jgi:Reverse transcriptase (RNA-dependent DNA polymerase)
LYGLKQSGRMWYNRLSEYLIKERYKSNVISHCVYVDDLNIIGSLEEIEKTVKLLKNEFEIKDIGVTKLCLGLQIEHLHNDIFVHQSNYI